MGETSALACLIGGLYLCLRRTAAWQIPLGAIVGLGVLAGIDNLVNPAAEWTALHHLLGGAFLVGLSLYLKRRVGHVDAQRRKRCASCDKVSIIDGRFCPYCGRER